MNTIEIILMSLIIGLPALVTIIALPVLRSAKFQAKYDKVIEIIIIKKFFSIKQYDFIVVVFLVLLFGWLDYFLPLYASLGLTFFTLLSFPIIKTKIVVPNNQDDVTNKLVSKLSAIESDIDEVKTHLSILQSDLTDTQKEVDQKLKTKQELEEQIRKNKDSAETWEKLSQNQRDIVSDAAVLAIRKKTKGEFWSGLVIGFIINLLASLAWALLGNPGKQDILLNLKSLFPSIFN